jgi:3-hydroxyacyl-[acyl-carrier-protein] dehydratase
MSSAQVLDSGLFAADIARILPHRHPMLLVDRVVRLEPGARLTARKAVTAAEPCFARLGREPAEPTPAYPTALVVESWCQAAGILATCGEPSPDVLTGRVMLIGSMAGVRVLGRVVPGDVIEHRVRLARVLPHAVVFDGDAMVDGSAVLDVERLVMTLRPADSLLPALSGEVVGS